MSELKPGDKVWIGPGTVTWFPDETCDPTVDIGHYATTAQQNMLIPDVPNLAAAARVLAANPGIGEALTRALNYVGSVHGDGNPEQYDDDVDGWGDDIWAIGNLAAALNGGTE